MDRRRAITVGLGLGVLGLVWGVVLWVRNPFPPDSVPEGAYLRIAQSLGRGEVVPIFPYLEEPAQHACFTIRDYRRKSSELVATHYPEPDRARLVEAYRPYAEAPDGSDVFAIEAAQRGWIARLRRDLSGIASVAVEGERATVVTARGTRYPFRKRPNGIWGLTLFTAELVAEAERAARDHDVVARAAADYARATPSKASAP
jgi:hypothetical protein